MRLGSGNFDLPIREHVDILLDPEHSLTVADLTANSRYFRQARTRDFELDFTQGRYWLRFAIANDQAEQRYAILHLTPSHIDSVRLFRHDSTEIAQVDYSGILRAPQLFVINLEPHSQQVYYLSLAGHGKLLLNPKLTDLHPFLIEFRAELFGNGVGIGLLLAIAAANLTMALVLPHARAFLLLGVYAICNMLTIAASWGYIALHRHVASLFENPAFVVLTHLSMLIALLLSEYFQPSRRKHQQGADLGFWSILVSNVCAGVTAVFLPISSSMPIMLIVVGLSSLWVTLRALQTYLKFQETVTYHYLFSRAWLTLFVALVALIYLHVDAGLETINLILLLGTAIEVLMLTVIYSTYRQHKTNERFERRLQVATLEAESRGGNESLRRINQDLMTPLSAIFGTAEMLKNSQLTPQQREYVSSLQAASQEMLGFIENVRSHPPLAGELSTTPELLYDLRPLLQDIFDSYQAELLWQNPETPLPQQVIGDPGRLRQLLLHLIMIASHHSQETGIALHLEWRNGLWLELRYRGKKALSLVESRDSAKHSDAGIHTRAELARQLVETLHGELRLHSLGQEQFIELSLPLSIWEHQQRLPKLLQLRSRRILIVEPNRTFAMQQKRLCEQWGMIAFVAHNRQQAIALSRNQCLFKTPIDVVLLSDTIDDPISLNHRLHDEAAATQLPPPATIFLQDSGREFPATARAPFRVMARPSAGLTLKRLIVELLESVETDPQHAEAADLR
ncbi:signal transduction histidine kinase [Litorivivens lipolytica]|uniref:histidine kinase n=1 Tax=Litorivivens lipolytica TaxID=1524264 RepID=A0A7W4W619_9GAMM|nr:7TM-DISM domain-containing protein [Litorivivens lipolytica]MBB3048146.1 signal transduction histidine kinase [Litorivivens lipolytica]